MARPQTLHEHAALGAYFYERGAYNLAIAQFRLALRAALVPMAALHVNLGAAYLATKRHHEARLCLERALAIEPANAAAKALLARLTVGQERPGGRP